MTPRENLKAFFKGNDYEWIPSSADIKLFNPRELHDHVARGMVMDGFPFNRNEESGGKGWFDVDWNFEAEVGGSMSIGRMMDDLSDWRDVLVWPNLDEIDWEGIAARNKEYLTTDKMIQTTIFCGYFERLISFVEFEEAAIALLDPDYEDDVKELFDKLTDLYIDYLGRMNKYFNIEMVEFHDDWGNQRACMFSKDTHAEMIIPYIKRIVDFCHENDIIYLQHSCGWVEALFDNFIDAGIDTWMGQEIPGLKWTLVQRYADKFIFQVGLQPDDKLTLEETNKFIDGIFEQYKPYKVWFRGTRGCRPDQFKLINERLVKIPRA